MMARSKARARGRGRGAKDGARSAAGLRALALEQLGQASRFAGD